MSGPELLLPSSARDSNMRVSPLGDADGLWDGRPLRFISSFRDLVRPQKKKRRAARMVMLALVMDMAIMAPVERRLLVLLVSSVTGLDVGVLVGGLLGEGVSSVGKGSPGLSMYLLSSASCCCFCTLAEALGLMTPTIP